MTLAFPLALLLLLPWAATAWLVWRRPTAGRPRAVPFVRLWQAGTPRARGRLGRPPWPVVLGLAALLLLCLAAMQPRISTRFGQSVLVDVIRPADEIPVASEIDLLRQHPSTVVTSESAVDVEDLWPTAFARARDGGNVIVLGGTRPPADLPNLHWMPTPPVAAVGIAGASVGDAGELAVSLWRTSDGPEAVRVRTFDGRQTSKQFAEGDLATIALIPPSTDRDARHLEVGANGASVRLERQGDWSGFRRGEAMPTPVERMLAALEAARPATEAKLFVTTEPLAGRSGVHLAALNATVPALSQRVACPLPPIDWNGLGPFDVADTDPPGQGWEPLLTADGIAVVAFRETAGGARQVWFGVSSQALHASEAYVQLWAELHTWLSRGGPRWIVTGTTSPSAEATDAGETERWLAARARGPALARPLILVAGGFLACAAWRISR